MSLRLEFASSGKPLTNGVIAKACEPPNGEDALMIFFRRLFETRPLFVTMLQIAVRGIVLATGLGLTVGATSRVEAGQIITYTFSGDVGGGDGSTSTLTGSFQVDSDHISASGNTDISSFITGLSFSAPVFTNSPPFMFDAATGFVPKGVLVAPDGELTGGGALGFSTFEGLSNIPPDQELPINLQVLTINMFSSSTLVDIPDVGQETGTGDWCNNDPNTPPPFRCLPGSPEAVPEPATLVLVAVPMLLCVWYARWLGLGGGSCR
jgi:hypothetical protein